MPTQQGPTFDALLSDYRRKRSETAAPETAERPSFDSMLSAYRNEQAAAQTQISPQPSPATPVPIAPAANEEPPIGGMGRLVDLGSRAFNVITRNRTPADQTINPMIETPAGRFDMPRVQPMSMDEEVGRLRAADAVKAQPPIGGNFPAPRPSFMPPIGGTAPVPSVAPESTQVPTREEFAASLEDYTAPLTDMTVGENAPVQPKPDVPPIWLSTDQVQPSEEEFRQLQQRALDLVNESPTRNQGVSINDIKPEHRALFLDQVYRAAVSRGDRGGQNLPTKFAREVGRSLIDAKEGISRTAESIGDYVTGAPPRQTPEQAAFDRDVLNALEAGNNPTLGEPTAIKWALQAVPSATQMAAGLAMGGPLGGGRAAATALGKAAISGSQAAYWTTQIAPEEINKIYASGKVDKDTATRAGLLSAAIQGAIETIEVNPFRAGTGAGIRGLRNRVIDVAKTYGKEILTEEGLQAATSEIIRGSVTNELDAQKVVEETVKGVKDALGPGLFLVGSGGAVNVAQGVSETVGDIQDRRQARAIDERTQSLQALDATRPAANRTSSEEVRGAPLAPEAGPSETQFQPPPPAPPTGPGFDQNDQPPSRTRRADEAINKPLTASPLNRSQQGIADRIQRQPPIGGIRTMRMSVKDAKAVGNHYIDLGYDVNAELAKNDRAVLTVSAEPVQPKPLQLPPAEPTPVEQPKVPAKQERQALETQLAALQQTLKVGGLRPREVAEVESQIAGIESQLQTGRPKQEATNPKRVIPQGQDVPVTPQPKKVPQPEVQKKAENYTSPQPNVSEPQQPAPQVKKTPKPLNKARATESIPKPKKAPRPAKPKSRSKAADSARRQLAAEYDQMVSRGDLADIDAIDAQINDESTNIETLTPAGVTFTADQAGEARQLREMLGGGVWANDRVRIVKEGERFAGTTGDEILHELAQRTDDPMGMLAESIRRQSGGDTANNRTKQVLDAVRAKPELMQRMDPQSVHAMRVLEALESGDKDVAKAARKVKPGEGDVLFQEQLKVGDEFEIAGDKYRVVQSSEDGTILKDGETLSLDPGEMIAVDSGTALLQQVNPPAQEEEFDTSFDIAELEAQTASEEAAQEDQPREGHSTGLFGQDVIEDVEGQATFEDVETEKIASTNSVFRETSAGDAELYLPNSRTKAGSPFGKPELYFATTPELATGQGDNKGVLIEFDNAFESTPRATKPGAEFVAQRGGGEERVARIEESELRPHVRAVTIKKGAQGTRGEIANLRRSLRDLVKSGSWTEESQDNGDIVFRKNHSTDQAGESLPSERGAGTALNAKGVETSTAEPATPSQSEPEGSQQSVETPQDFKSEQANRIVEATKKRIRDGEDVAGAVNQSRITKLTNPNQIRVSKSGGIQIPEGNKWVAIGLNEEIRLAKEAGIEYEYPPSDKEEEPSDDRTIDEIMASAVSVAADDVSQLRAGDIDRVLDEAKEQGLSEEDAIEWLSKQDLQDRTKARITESVATPALNVIGYNATTDAITNASTGDIYSLIRTIKRRSGQLAYEVKGYSKLEGKYPEIEGIYEARGKEEAIAAAKRIAELRIKEQQPTREVAPTIPDDPTLLYQSDGPNAPQGKVRIDEKLPFNADNIAKVFRIPKSQAAAIEAVAKAMDIDTNRVELRKGRRTGKRLILGGKAKGAVDINREGNAVIWATGAADISTGLHELAHVARRTILNRDIAPNNRPGITDEHITIAEQWAGAEGGQWTREAEERFARGFERYMRDGSAPTKQLKGLFDTIRKWLGSIYRRIKGSNIDIGISPEMRKVYDALVSRGDPGVTIETSAAKKARQAKSQADRIMEKAKTQKRVDDGIRKEAVKLAIDNLPVEERGKANVLKSINNARTLGTLRKAISTMENLATSADHREARRDFAKALKEAKQAKLRPEFAQIVDDIASEIDQAKMTERMKQALRSTAAFLESNPDAPVPAKVVERLRRLNQQSLADMEPVEIRALTDAIRAAIHQSKFKNYLIGKSRKRTRDEYAENIIAEASERMPKLREGRSLLQRITKKPEIGPRRGSIGLLFKEAGARPETLMENLSPTLRDLVWEDIGVQAYHQELKKLWGFKDALRRAVDAAAPHRIGSRAFEKWRQEPIKINFGTQSVTMLRDEMIWLYTTMRDPTNRALIEANGFSINRLNRDMRINKTFERAVETNMGPAEKAISDFMFQEFNGDMKATLNDAWRQVYGVDVANVENYVPRRIDMNRADTKKDPIEQFALDRESTLTSWGSLRERVGASAPLKIGLAMDVFSDHAAHVSRISSYLGPVSNAHAILGRADVKQEIIQRGGTFLYERILAAIQMQTVRQGDRTQGERRFRRVMRNVGASILGFRPSTLLLNPSGIAISGSYQGFDLIPRSVPSGLSPAAWKETIALARKYSPYWRERYDDFMRESTAGQLDGGKHFGAKTLADIALTPLEMSDQFGGVVRWRMSELYVERNGTSRDAPDFYDKVAREWERSMFRSENTSHGMELNGALAYGRRNPIAGTFVMFESSTSKIYSSLIRSALAMRRGEVKKATAAMAGFLGAVAWASAVRVAMQMARGTGDDDESFVKRVAKKSARDVASMVPVLGESAIEPAIATVIGEQRSAFRPSVAIDVLSNAANGIADLTIALNAALNDELLPDGSSKSRERFIKAAERLGGVGAQLTGVPLDGPQDIYKIVNNLSTQASSEDVATKAFRKLEKKEQALKTRLNAAVKRRTRAMRSVSDAELTRIRDEEAAKIPEDMLLTKEEYLWLKAMRSEKSRVSKAKKDAMLRGEGAIKAAQEYEANFWERAEQAIPKPMKKAG